MKKLMSLVVASFVAMCFIGCGDNIVFVEETPIIVYVDGGTMGGSVYSGSMATIENLIVSVNPGEIKTIKVSSGDELSFVSNSGGGLAFTINSYTEVYFNSPIKCIISPVEE